MKKIFSNFRYEKVYLNDSLEFECQKSSYNLRNTMERCRCYVSNALVLYLFTNIVEYKHFFDKIACGKQIKLI